MQHKIDFFVSYSFRTSRKKEIKDDAYVGLMVRDGHEVPERPTRSMIEALRMYLSGQHQVKPTNIRIENIIRLDPDVTEVPDGDKDSVPVENRGAE